MGPGVPRAPTGVEVWMGAPTNVMPRGSGSWVGWGCSVESGTSDVQEGQERRGGRLEPGRTRGWPGRAHPPSPHLLPLEVAVGPPPADGWGPGGYPRSGSASRTRGASDSTRLFMGLARTF